MKFSKKIIDIRNKNNLTQEELSEILFVSRQTISNWENDKCYPDIETLNIISNRFNIPLDILLKEDESVIKDISKKAKTNKISKLVIITLVVAITIMIFIGYKMYLLCYYNTNFSVEIFEKFVDRTKEIKVENNKKANKKYENMNIYIPKMYYEDYKGKFISHRLYDSMTISKKDNLFDNLSTNKVYLKNIDYEKLFKNNNIDNQVHLLKYVKDNYKNSTNILFNKDKLELKFISQYFVVNEINNKPSIFNYYYFESDIVGKLIHRNCDYLIEIYNNNETYIIKIESPFLKIDDVLKIVNSIYFD